jgi:hypothetical protein
MILYHHTLELNILDKSGKIGYPPLGAADWQAAKLSELYYR